MKAKQSVLAVCLIVVSIWAGYSLGQPQPRLEIVDPNWALLEFENGAQWYVNGASIHAIWAIPEPESKKLGYKTRIYGSGFSINAPLTVEEIVVRLSKEETKALEGFIRKGQESD